MIFAAFYSFLWTFATFASFGNAGKVELTMHLLNFDVRKPAKISEFYLSFPKLHWLGWYRALDLFGSQFLKTTGGFEPRISFIKSS